MLLPNRDGLQVLYRPPCTLNPLGILVGWVFGIGIHCRLGGRDELTQNQVVVEAVRQARPDMMASDALAAVELVRQLLSRNQMIY